MAKSTGNTGKLSVNGKYVSVQHKLEKTKVSPPKELAGMELTIWHKIVDTTNFDHWTESDFPIMVAYCQNYVMLIEAQMMLETDGVVLTDDKGKRYKHPAFDIHQSTTNRIIALAGKLRLAPNARVAKTSVTAKQPDQKPSAMGALLG